MRNPSSPAISIRSAVSLRSRAISRFSIPAVDCSVAPAGKIRSLMSTRNAPITAPRGNTLRCKGWRQEAALRMLMNNLDPEVAENPDQLIVYGGTGRAARDWPSYHAIVRALRSLEDD